MAFLVKILIMLFYLVLHYISLQNVVHNYGAYKMLYQDDVYVNSLLIAFYFHIFILFLNIAQNV